MDEESAKELSKFFEATAPSLAELETSYRTLFNFRPADYDQFYNDCMRPILRRTKLTEIYDTYQMQGPVGLAANRDRNGEFQYFAIEAGTIKCLREDFSDIIEQYNPNDCFLYFYKFVDADVWWSKHLSVVGVNYDELGADILTKNIGFGLRGNFVKKYDI
jgi:hypothetical protein